MHEFEAAFDLELHYCQQANFQSTENSKWLPSPRQQLFDLTTIPSD